MTFQALLHACMLLASVMGPCSGVMITSCAAACKWRGVALRGLARIQIKPYPVMPMAAEQLWHGAWGLGAWNRTHNHSVLRRQLAGHLALRPALNVPGLASSPAPGCGARELHPVLCFPGETLLGAAEQGPCNHGNSD